MTLGQAIRVLVIFALFFGLAGSVACVTAAGTMLTQGAGTTPGFTSHGWKPVQLHDQYKTAGFLNESLDTGSNYQTVAERGPVLTLWKPSGYMGLRNISGYPGITPGLKPGRTGYLEGVVTIGPLCPVEPCQVSDEQRTLAYGARSLVITSEGFSAKVYTVKFEPDGHYHIELPAGRYRVTIGKNGMDRSPDVPVSVVITRGKTVTFSLSIDTGIR